MILVVGWSTIMAQTPTAEEILEKVDKNMASESRIITSKMVIKGKRATRTIESKTWSKGETDAFTEYLSPAREKGTKMLKLEDKLWIYSPSTDRIIQISGHMLRQSVMGSDMSYEDMMTDNKLTDNYTAKIVGTSTIDSRKCHELELIAKTDDVAYYKRKIWIDEERYVPLKEELYAKSGKLLKRTTLSDVTKIDGRWFPKKIVFKDMLKDGEGTEFIVVDIEFDAEIPEHILSKANLKK